MAAGTLIIAMIFFAARGYFLGLAGVFARVLGLIGGYIVGFSYRTELAAMIAARTEAGSHPLILQVVSGALLFFGTMFLVSLTVIGLFKLLARLLPPFRAILTREATGSRIAGAAVNAGIAAMVVLTGIYIYGLTLGKNQPPDDLQRVANRFGDTMVDVARNLVDGDEVSTGQSITVQTFTRTSASGDVQRGSAEIISSSYSSSRPDRRIAIEQVQEIFTGRDGRQPDLQALLANEQLRNLINDPEVRRQAMQYLESNPQQMMEALNNPEFRALMEQWEPR